MTSVILRRVVDDEHHPWAPDVNPWLDVLGGMKGGGILLSGHDGTRRDNALSTNYALDVSSQAVGGLHAAFPLKATSSSVARTPANSVLLVQDAGVFLGAGGQFRIYGPAGTNFGQFTADDTGKLTLAGTGASNGDLSMANLTLAGNLTMTGTVRRILADFSNGTVLNRAAFQSSTVNGNTVVPVLPNGTARGAGFNLYDTAAATGAGFQLVALAGEGRLNAFDAGGGAPFFTIYTGGAEQVRVGATGLLTLTQGQVKFPATQVPSADANTLDDYEEGTWTPSLGGTSTLTASAGAYIKVGRLVIAWVDMTVNAIGTGSATTISGLPFTADRRGVGGVARITSAVANAVSWRCYADSATIVVEAINAAGAASSGVSTFGNGTAIDAMVIYRTAN